MQADTSTRCGVRERGERNEKDDGTHLNCKLFASAFSSSATTTAGAWPSRRPRGAESCVCARSGTSIGGRSFPLESPRDIAATASKSDVGGPAFAGDAGEAGAHVDADAEGELGSDGPGESAEERGGEIGRAHV